MDVFYVFREAAETGNRPDEIFPIFWGVILPFFMSGADSEMAPCWQQVNDIGIVGASQCGVGRLACSLHNTRAEGIVE
jgi:hypothetical protein